jgi:NitT/TauT family transport system substrate-binding protein
MNRLTLTRRHALMMAPLLATTAGTLTTSKAGAADLKPFKLGVSATVATMLAAWFGDACGAFERQGLKIQVVSMEGGTRGTQVLLSGEIQAMHVGLSPVVQANAHGADLRAVVSASNTLPMTIFTRKKFDPPLPKGAKFGISTFGSETDIAISLLLPKLGMTRNDIEITQVGGTGQRYAALLAGRLDAAPLMEPAVTQAKQKGFIPIYDLGASGAPWVFDAVVVTKAYLDANRDTVERFVRGYIEGAQWAFKEEAKAKELIAAKFRTKDAKVIDATYEEFKKQMPPDGHISLEGAKNVIEQLAALKVPVKSRKIEDYVDTGPLDDLAKQGFFAELQKKYGVAAK